MVITRLYSKVEWNASTIRYSQLAHLTKTYASKLSELYRFSVFFWFRFGLGTEARCIIYRMHQVPLLFLAAEIKFNLYQESRSLTRTFDVSSEFYHLNPAIVLIQRSPISQFWSMLQSCHSHDSKVPLSQFWSMLQCS